ncbi:MAG TPA: catalase, partial [Ureibacillus sp.]|nr:catalase [Ureibacillus sp.]
SEYPLIPVGEFELNKNAENYFADVEQAAFAPSNVVPGIGFSPDRMLQARLFAYADATRYRLGVNHYQIPVNQPRCPFMVYHRDGQGRVDGNNGSALTYYPNSYGALQAQPQYKEPALALDGGADIYDFREDDNNYFEQPGKLFNLMSAEQQEVLFQNTAENLQGVEEFIQRRHILHCYLADPAYGEGVAKALGLTLDGMDLSNPYLTKVGQ